jgi:hypothetical protein
MVARAESMRFQKRRRMVFMNIGMVSPAGGNPNRFFATNDDQAPHKEKPGRHPGHCK